MIVACPNLALDHIVRIDRLRPGEVQRFRAAVIKPGGKGVNVCRAAARIGARSSLVAFAPGRGGAAAAAELTEEGIDVTPVPAPGELRSATIVLEDSGRVTVLNEPGPALDRGRWERFEAATAARLAAGEWLVVIGSAPPGTPADGYGRLIRLAHEIGARVLVDAAERLLTGALAARPDAVCPNVQEAAAMLGLPPDQPRRLAEILVDRGAQMAFVKAGADGCAWVTPDGSGAAAAHHVEVVNPIGAGDCFVAGLVSVLEGGGTVEAAIRQAMAVAAASVEHEVPGFVDPDRVAALSANLPVA